MDFESPDVMKEFPGLYASEISKRLSNDSDYSDETEKAAKKDILGKRKDKKDKKDKDRGYAALEGESSADENDGRSLSKLRKAKAFKFSSKSKEKREKSREKEVADKWKEKDKKSEKKVEKSKTKADKKEKKSKSDENTDIAEGLPIFGVPLEQSVERSRCHDGIDLPLPVRACIDYVQSVGLTMEGVYKVSGTKSKVIQLRKLYNQRATVDLTEYEIPIATSLLKMYLRDLPEPVFTSDLLTRFEEAGAILNIGTREKHFKILVENLPKYNRILLSWLLLHFDNVALNERHNKMNLQHVVAALAPVMHTSNKLLTALLHHCRAMFPLVILDTYVPPLSSSAILPETLDSLNAELRKQESLLSQIHSEMNSGFISKSREELLWEVQRIITQLKRKLKNMSKEGTAEKAKDSDAADNTTGTTVTDGPASNNASEKQNADPDSLTSESSLSAQLSEATCQSVVNGTCNQPPTTQEDRPVSNTEEVAKKVEGVDPCLDEEYIALLRRTNVALNELKNRLQQSIITERNEIAKMRKQLNNNQQQPNTCQRSFLTTTECGGDFEKLLDLLQKENQVLHIKKVNLVRKIMEQEEACINLRAKLSVAS